MSSPFFSEQEKFFDIKKLTVGYHKKINDILKECFGVTRAYAQDKMHFGKFELVSYLNVTPMTIELQENEYKLGGVCSVSTLPEFRSRGYASALVETALEWMEDNEFDIAVLFATDERLYNNLGFVKGPEELNKKPSSPKEEGVLCIMAKKISQDIDFELFDEANIKAWKKMHKF